MYWIDPESYNNSSDITNFFADDVSDIANLPTNTEYGVQQGDDNISNEPCGIGSSCMVIGNGSGAEVYMMRSDGRWVKI